MLSITSAKSDNLKRYIDVLEEAAEWLNSRGLGQVPASLYRQSVAYFSDSIERGEVHLAFIDGHIVATLRLLSQDRIVWPEADHDALYVHNLVVCRAWRGRGLGRQMLDWAEQQTAIAAKRHLRLDCFASNGILRKYYEQAGFVGRGEVDAQYPFGILRLQRYEKEVRRK